MGLENKKIILGVTGSIAAYKSAEIISRLKKEGAIVYPVMTANATKFITPLTLYTLSENIVRQELFPADYHERLPHISLADEADLLLIAPATANIINKIAAGIADDLLSTLALSVTSPIVICPAMNVNMYNNKITQQNITKLKNSGYEFIEPDIGKLACGIEAKGRLADIEKIIDRVKEILTPRKQDFTGKKILITAACTQEPIDKIRFISNYSTGKMGYCLADAASKRGAAVTLVSGPTNLTIPNNVKLLKVQTAHQMYEVVLKNFKEHDIVIAAAAVVDFTPEKIYKGKIKKQPTLTLKLVKTPDIIGEVGKIKNDKILVGFAAEEAATLISNAKKKLKEKNLDMIIANPIDREEVGMGSDYNEATIIMKDGKIEKLGKLTKKELANIILDRVKEVM